jgi:hypothetical protein
LTPIKVWKNENDLWGRSAPGFFFNKKGLTGDGFITPLIKVCIAQCEKLKINRKQHPLLFLRKMIHMYLYILFIQLNFKFIIKFVKLINSNEFKNEMRRKYIYIIFLKLFFLYCLHMHVYIG